MKGTTLMGPLVIIAYNDYGDTAVEQEILNVLEAQIVQVDNLLSLRGTHEAEVAEALMVTTQPVTAEILAHMPRCRIVSRAGTGLDAIDVDGATRRGIWVANVPDYGVDEVSTHAITLLLAHARRLPQYLESTRRGIWDYRVVAPIRRLKGQTLGLVGFGRIARAVAHKAQALGLRVLAHDRFVDDREIAASGVHPAGFETLLRESDFVSLHTPLTNTTRHMIDSDTLALMKPTALLINTARGALIDDHALLAAVRAGRIAGAALDVLPIEPPPPDYELLQEERIWLTPHIAWYSESASHDMRTGAAEEVVRVLRGEQPRSGVNHVDGARSKV